MTHAKIGTPAPAAILFSGGTDSTLAAVLMLEEGRDVTLLTFNPGFVLFLDNCRNNATRLQDRYGAERVRHEMLDNAAATRRVLWGDRARDAREYGFNMSALVCLGCRLAMHARAIIYCLEHSIPYLVDGSIADQSTVPEQLPSVLARHREFYREEFGIHHRSPIYDESRSDRRLEEMGVPGQKDLKRQFILFDTQGTCPFGVTADVYGRMFYRLMPQTRERESEQYCKEKYPLLRQVVYDHFSQRGLVVADLVERLREGVRDDVVQ